MPNKENSPKLKGIFDINSRLGHFYYDEDFILKGLLKTHILSKDCLWIDFWIKKLPHNRGAAGGI